LQLAMFRNELWGHIFSARCLSRRPPSHFLSLFFSTVRLYAIHSLFPSNIDSTSFSATLPRVIACDYERAIGEAGRYLHFVNCRCIFSCITLLRRSSITLDQRSVSFHLARIYTTVLWISTFFVLRIICVIYNSRKIL